MKSWLATISVLIATSSGASSQQIGIEICSCAPNTYEFTLDFSLFCPPVNITIGDAVLETSCLVSPKSDPLVEDLIPVSVQTVDVLELGQDLRVLVQEKIEGNFLDGDTLTYTSVAATPGGIVDLVDIPRAIQVNLAAVNAADEQIINVYIISFTNNCGQYPVLFEGQSAGWTRFSNLGAPSEEFCPLLTPAPTSPPPDAPVPTVAPVLPTVAPVVPPTEAPVVAPTMAPVVTPTMAPMAPPTEAPVATTTGAPVATPTMAPVAPPTEAPVVPPTEAPVVTPTMAPVVTPTLAPISPAPVAMSMSMDMNMDMFDMGNLMASLDDMDDDLGYLKRKKMKKAKSAKDSAPKMKAPKKEGHAKGTKKGAKKGASTEPKGTKNGDKKGEPIEMDSEDMQPTDLEEIVETVMGSEDTDAEPKTDNKRRRDLRL